MLFGSYIFVFLFLPLVVIGYFLLNKLSNPKLALCFLLGMSLWFYGYFNWHYLFIIIASIIANYVFAALMDKNRKKRPVIRVVFGLALLFNIGLIFYYKYYDFFVSSINSVFGTSIVLKNTILPLGISFFTIQQISYIVDVFWGRTERISLLEYAVYVSFFPQLVAGPIVRYDELVPQIKNPALKKINIDNLSAGIYCFVLGLSKKILIADMFGKVADYGFTNYATLNSFSLLLAIFAYTIQIYFDFSGYSDMAIGLGQMLNFSLPINFDSPYKAVNITDFWNRWHLTLTRFLREYIYFPLGGSRKGKVRTYINIGIVFLVSGIWHGANWTFFLWGGIHGIAMILHRLAKKVVDRIPKCILWVGNFIFLMVTWCLFRADSVSQAVEMLGHILRFETGGLTSYMRDSIIPVEIRTMTYLLSARWPKIAASSNYIAAGVILLVMIFVLFGKNVNEKFRNFKPNLGNCVGLALLSWLCILSFSNVSTFLYFNF